jgi:hypothetical protein
MGRFEAIGMRTRVSDPGAIVINTCSGNDTADRGDPTRWTWSNPTNRRYPHQYHGRIAVSTEALWQGTKLRDGATGPDEQAMAGEWRRGKGKRPTGAWAGPGQPPITSPGEARRRIYVPAFRHQIESWLSQDAAVREWVQAAKDHSGMVYLRDHDTGRGIDRNGPMSHAWLLSVFLNDGKWPT